MKGVKDLHGMMGDRTRWWRTGRAGMAGSRGYAGHAAGFDFLAGAAMVTSPEKKVDIVRELEGRDGAR